MKPRHFPPHRPPLWIPAGQMDARDWHRVRRQFFWRVSILFAFLVVFGCGIVIVASWFVGNWAGFWRLPRTGLPFGIGAFVLILIGLFLVARAFRHLALPIGDLVGAAERVAEGDYSARVAEQGPREIRVLARAFNSMAGRLQAQDEQRRAMLADVTHELRTPLTVIQGNLEGLLDGVYPRDDAHLTPILDETRVLSRLVDDLRMLALTESGALQLQKEPVDLAVLVSETVAWFQAQANELGVVLQAETTDVPLLELDPARIRQVLENLIANALRYTPREGRATIRCAVSGEPPNVSVSVRDSGSGISADELPRIFERFYKSRDSRGMGLGLAIAKNLVVAHGGEMFAQSEIGKGTTIGFALPVRQV